MYVKYDIKNTGRTREYNSWKSMIARCTHKNHDAYKNYGGRGINVCDEWMDFENFYRDMGIRGDGKTLDRIDNNKGYYKDNCVWSSSKDQCNNRRNNVFINGKRISEVSLETGISTSTLLKRIYSGTDINKPLAHNNPYGYYVGGKNITLNKFLDESRIDRYSFYKGRDLNGMTTHEYMQYLFEKEEE